MRHRFALAAVLSMASLGHPAVAVVQPPEPLPVLSSNGLRAVLLALQPEFERVHRRPVTADFAPAALLGERIGAGEACDVAMLTPIAMDAAIAAGHVAGPSRVVLARSLAGLAMKARATKPEMATVPALVRTLRAARSIGYATQGASAKPFEALINRLGLGDIRSRIATPTAGSDVGNVVAKGEVQYGVLPLSEIVNVEGLELAGVFPAEVQFPVVMVGGVSARARDADAAAQLLRFLSDARHARVFERPGMERSVPSTRGRIIPPR